jgi:GAF domain-containing protein
MSLRIRVFVQMSDVSKMNSPVPLNEEQRIHALRQYAILDSEPEQSFDDIAALAAYICDVPMATITLVDSDRQWFKSRIGVEATETPRNVSFCAHTILGKDPLIVRDALDDPRFSGSPLVQENPKIRFYAGFPLTTTDEHNLGALCAIDKRPRELSAAQQTAMAALSRQVMALLNLRRASASLADALSRVKTLEGLLPMCAWCKRIRDEDGHWSRLEQYFAEHSSASFTHGICEDCLQQMKP